MTGTPETFDFVVKRDDLRETAVLPSPPEDEITLSPGQALLRIDSFSVTANNITYGAMGELMGYWKFFPADDDWGRVPAWGYAEVARSESDAVEVGTRVFGFLPMSSHLVVEPGEVTETGFVDSATHRSELAAVYNRYGIATAEPGYRASREPFVALFAPLFTTSFMLEDWLAEESFFGARRVILSSASSKTALGLAFLLKRDHGDQIQIVGLTSGGNVEFVTGTGMYDEVASYEELGDVDPETPTAYLDFAGNAELLSRIHNHFDELLVASVRIGATAWDSLVPEPDSAPLAGPEPTLFFAPSRVALRTADWGGSELRRRVSLDQDAFIESTGAWLRISTGRGADAIRTVYLEFLEGQADPAEGWSLSP